MKDESEKMIEQNKKQQAAKPDVSIIIVNWNTRDVLRDCLKSIYQQTNKCDFEIIVVDNASSDGSAQMVKSEFENVFLIENMQNRGYAGAANQGILIAKGRYALILNSDIIIYDGAIDKVVEYADFRDDAAIVTCQVLQDQNTVQMTCFRFPSVLNLLLSASGLAKLFEYNKFLGRELMLWWKRDSTHEVDAASGMFLLVRRKAIEEVGMFDESFFLYYEETDWCRRFSDAGWKIIFWPQAKILHIHGGSQSSSQKAAEMFAQQRKSMLIYFRKHHSRIAYGAARLILGASFAVKLLIWNAILLFRFLSGISTHSAANETRKCWGVLKVCIAENL
jgi:GT2 family glycosyltransferase